jgi:hypothetical protein
VPGFFDIASPEDLFQKVGRELDRMRKDPVDSDHAFNFFVTAEHLLDWSYPGNEGRSEREAERRAVSVLEITWDLANGAKHFKLFDAHKSVLGTKRLGGFWAKGFWAEGFWAKGMFAEPKLVVELSNDQAAELGENPTAIELAEQVHAYWADKLGEA